ncbi:uncharacterized protein LOC131659728 [Vicia villosa]|uniref:uncharacterized protein LOC131659728 n=1 Tax=Vicia villosa TaxID=3911 RepID=UPI00273A82ED|nr:uncharacterized protein LOC131659728 [Vicia villosa]
MTITLDDVSCLLHVPIRGKLVDPDSVVTDCDAIHLTVELFGVSLSDATREASSVRDPYSKLDWLKQVFQQQRAADNFIGATRAYMMLLFGCTILADKTFTLFELGGYASLLHVQNFTYDLVCWIHEYFSTVGKRGTSGLCCVDSPMARAMKWEYRQGTQKVDDIRVVLDQLTPHDIIWRPFEDHRQHRALDDICLYRGGLKWYGTIVLYLPDRCMHQFGYRQYILIAPPLTNPIQ